MKKTYSVEEIQKIEKKEFKRLKNSYILMKRAGTNCAKKIHKSKKNKNSLFCVDQETMEAMAWLSPKF